ncbi:uncharacterized protein [Physcomitrium patens]|uniref:uncharacterized protein isoform X2 n=1 Tax=Physcomitrium patens TaxID=3218 RepID=UPI000D1575D1|nr:uncharacterized protein LOC112293680 isoform X2 [Physcomitrium patens]|eukprot:XP_024399183.1 uncharacterized protein LOC112293680 isoform X2 [Physcomitrella patens]
MPPHNVEIECTAYCRCGYCCNWEWGLRLPVAFPFYLGFSLSLMPVRLRARKKGNREPQRLPFFCKFWTATTQSGQPYYGLTSSGSYPAQARPPIFSQLSLMNYRNLPARLLFFPWRLLPRHGTIAADTDYYPFGTRMFIPGYGWGEAWKCRLRIEGAQLRGRIESICTTARIRLHFNGVVVKFRYWLSSQAKVGWIL